MKKVEVTLVNAKAYELHADRSLLVTVDPQFADYIEDIENAIISLVGHEKVVCLPLPLESIKFYEIEHPYVIGVDPAVLGGDKSVVA